MTETNPKYPLFKPWLAPKDQRNEALILAVGCATAIVGFVNGLVTAAVHIGRHGLTADFALAQGAPTIGLMLAGLLLVVVAAVSNHSRRLKALEDK